MALLYLGIVAIFNGLSNLIFFKFRFYMDVFDKMIGEKAGILKLLNMGYSAAMHSCYKIVSTNFNFT